jgi:NTP pyrophosphatase (non-canonical NTP hydrolase)
MNKQEKIKRFLSLLELHTERKAKLYDGFNTNMTPNDALRYAIEELGEVASDITRYRYSSARDECIDLAHCVLLIYLCIFDAKDEIKCE